MEKQMRGRAAWMTTTRASAATLPVVVATMLAMSGSASAADCAGEKDCPYTSSSVLVAPNAGALATPTAVAIAPDDSVYVVDGHRRKVVHYSRGGAYLSSWGDEGQEPGPFGLPTGIAVDEAGNVWVADEFGSLERFTSSGTWLSDVGITEPIGVSYDGASSMKASSAAGVIASFSLAGADQGYFVPGGSEDFDLAFPEAIFAEPGGGTVAAVGDEVERFDASDAKIAHWGISRPEDEQEASPSGVAESGNVVLVADASNGVIKLYTTSGSFIESWGSPGNAPQLGALDDPQGMAVDRSDGSVVVADAGNHRIQRFTDSGLVTGEFGAPQGGELVAPGGLAEAADGSFWVADAGEDRVEHFDASGKLLGGVGPTGNGFSRLVEPADVAIAGDGDVYVTDRGNNRVVQLTSSGAFVRTFDGSGSSGGNLKAPAGIAVGATSVFVVDQGHDRVMRFDLDGAYQGSWGQEGSAVGRFRMPEGIGVTANGDVLVADSGNYRLQRLTADGTPVATFPAPGDYEPVEDAAELDDSSIAAIVSSSEVVDYAPDGSVKWSFDVTGGNDIGEDRGIVSSGRHLLLSDSLGDRVLRFDLRSSEENASTPPPVEEHASISPTEEGAAATPPTTPDMGTKESAPTPSGPSSSSSSLSTSNSTAMVSIVGSLPTGTPAPAKKRAGTTKSEVAGASAGMCEGKRFQHNFTITPGFEPVIVRHLNVCGRPGGTVLVRCVPARASCPRARTLSLGSASKLNLVAKLGLTRLPSGSALLIGYANGNVRTGIVFNVRRSHTGLSVLYEQLPCWAANKPEPGTC